MVQAICVQKFRDKNNQIYGYRLKDSTGTVRDVKPEALKNAIRNKQIYITNLTLTSDNRLVDTSTNTSKQKIQDKPAIISIIELERSLKFESREIENKYLSKYPKVVTKAIWVAVDITMAGYSTDYDYFLDGLYSANWEEELEKLNLGDEDIDTMYKCYLDLWNCLSKYHHIFLKRITDKYKDKYPEELLYIKRCEAIAERWGGYPDDLRWEGEISVEAEKELKQIEKEMVDLLNKKILSYI